MKIKVETVNDLRRIAGLPVVESEDKEDSLLTMIADIEDIETALNDNVDTGQLISYEGNADEYIKETNPNCSDDLIQEVNDLIEEAIEHHSKFQESLANLKAKLEECKE